MKRKVALLLCLALTGTFVFAGCGSSKGDSDGDGSGPAKESEGTKWASTDETFNPLEEEDAITFEELRECSCTVRKQATENKR